MKKLILAIHILISYHSLIAQNLDTSNTKEFPLILQISAGGDIMPEYGDLGCLFKGAVIQKNFRISFTYTQYLTNTYTSQGLKTTFNQTNYDISIDLFKTIDSKSKIYFFIGIDDEISSYEEEYIIDSLNSSSIAENNYYNFANILIGGGYQRNLTDKSKFFIEVKYAGELKVSAGLTFNLVKIKQ